MIRSRHIPTTAEPVAHRVAAGLLLCALALQPGCADSTDLSGTYIETFETASERPFAMRLTLFDFSSDVGGFVEYFEFSALNTVDHPFVSPHSCAYWGPLRRSGDIFRIRVPHPDAESVVIELERAGRGRFDGQIIEFGGQTLNDLESTLSFESDTSTRESEACPTRVPILSDDQFDQFDPSTDAGSEE